MDRYLVDSNGDCDILGLGLRGQVAGLRQIDLDLLQSHGHRDDEDDQEHQHDVDERRHVDVRQHLALVAAARCHCHGVTLLAGGCGAGLDGRR